MGQAFLMGQKKISAKPYRRPNEWLPIPAFESGKDEIYVLMAVYETDFNPIAFTISGDYTVNWGDGSAEESITGGTKAQHIFDWTDISSDTYFADRGYRQVLIRIYANSGMITSINFNVRHDNIATANPSSTILEINGKVSSCSSLAITDYEENIIYHGLLEIFNIEGTITQTDMSYMFYECTSLQSIPQLDTSSVTNMSDMFLGCYSLQSIPLLDTSSVTDMSVMFYECTSLQSIPQLDTSSVTNMSGMFLGCTSLQSIPLLDTSNVTNMNGMFLGCYSLRNLNFVQDSPKISFSVEGCQLSASELNTIFGQLAEVEDETYINVTNNPGAFTCNTNIAETKGWTVITQ